jgi:hypothetical protein
MKLTSYFITAIGIALCTPVHFATARPVPLSNEWTFFDPEGNSSITNQSASGYNATIADIRNTVSDGNGGFLTQNAVRPRIYQIFEDLDMTKIGDAIDLSFDLEFLTPVIDSNQGDLHFSLFDTSTNYEFIPLMHLGPNPNRESVGDFIKFRIDGFVTPDSATFDPANIVGMASGGNSRIGVAHHPGKPLAETGYVHHFQLHVERISNSELKFSISWSYRVSGPPESNPILNTTTYSFNSYNEVTGVIDGDANPATSDIWANSKLTQFNGFGLMFHDDDPFNQDNDPNTPDQGTVAISNFKVDYTTLEHPPYSIIEVIPGAGGANHTIRWEAQNGATYSVWTSTTLQSNDWLEVEEMVKVTGSTGEYLDELSPAADNRFYQVRWDPGQQ